MCSIPQFSSNFYLLFFSFNIFPLYLSFSLSLPLSLLSFSLFLFLYFSFSLSLSISSNTPPLENPAVLVCVFEKYFSLVRFDYGSRVIPRVASAITKIHRIRDAGWHRYEKNPVKEWKGAEKLIKGIRVARKRARADRSNSSLSLSLCLASMMVCSTKW